MERGDRVRTASLGFPRIGRHRELKNSVEGYWRGTVTEADLLKTARSLRKEAWDVQRSSGIDLIPTGDSSLYDHVLDHACLWGAIPARYGGATGDVGLDAYFAMARDGLLFRWLDYVHPTFRTPSRAILVHCLWAAVILLVRQNFETIVAGMAFAVLIFYAMTTVALFKLRHEGIGDEGSYRIPFYPLLPGIYLMGIVVLVIVRLVFEFEKSLEDLAFIATGIPFAFWFCRKKS